VAIVVATVVIPTWIAAVLLALRDRYFPTAPRPEPYGPGCPPKWARQHPLAAKLALLVLSPVILVSLVFVGIVVIPFCAWYYAALVLRRFNRGRRPAT
jgi:hypothetical protein